MEKHTFFRETDIIDSIMYPIKLIRWERSEEMAGKDCKNNFVGCDSICDSYQYVFYYQANLLYCFLCLYGKALATDNNHTIGEE